MSERGPSELWTLPPEALDEYLHGAMDGTLSMLAVVFKRLDAVGILDQEETLKILEGARVEDAEAEGRSLFSARGQMDAYRRLAAMIRNLQ